MSAAPWPVELRLRRRDQTLQVTFDDGGSFVLTAAWLRRMTPSAADRGHGRAATSPLKMDARGVEIVDVRPVGRYAVRLVFSDGHDTGLYTWPLLHRLGTEGEPAA